MKTKINFLEKIQSILTTDLILLLGYLLITFLWTWDLQDRISPSGNYEGLPPVYYWQFLNYAHWIFYFFYYILPIVVNGYWEFFFIHIAFAISFYFIAKKMKMEVVWIFATLLMLPIMRYGITDWGCRGFALPLLAMVWIYYFKRFNKKKSYYLLSILGMFIREYCLFINMYFIIEEFFEGIEFNNWKEVLIDLKGRIKRTIKNSKFEIVLCAIYFIYRNIFTTLGGINTIELGMFNFGSDQPAIIYLLTHPKVWIVLCFIFGMYYLILIKYPSLKIYAFLLIVILLCSLFGIIWEIEKIGSASIIIAFELLTNRNKKLK